MADMGEIKEGSTGRSHKGRSDGSGLSIKERKVLWISMIVGIIVGGVTFAYKVAEFIFTMSGEAAKGFADVPVTVYFAVAGGWLCLFTWCYLTGKFNHPEDVKFEMLAQEAAYERAGQ